MILGYWWSNTLKKYPIGDREVWVSKHQKLGYLIYDEKIQVDVSSDCIRVYLLDEDRAATFFKNLVRNKLLKIREDEEATLRSKIERYEAKVISKRKTRCYKCKKSLDSVNFSICKKCGWIRCQCGKCGCGYEKHETRKNRENI